MEMTGGSSTEGLGARTRKAIGWKLLSQGLATGLQMATTIVLARLLLPRDFGIVGMATMVTGLASIFRDLGLGQALVQRRSIEKVHLASAYWGTVVMGVLLAGLTILIAPYAGAFFKEPRLVAVLRVMSVSFLISPLATVPNALLQRNLDFRRPFYAGIAGSVVAAAVGITMALQGYSYWSLVWASLASTLAAAIAICLVTRHFPPLVPRFRGIRDLYGFGVGVTGASLFNYIAQQADYFVVGRWLNSAALGLYTRAFTLVHQPLAQVSGILSPVLFPAFSQMQNDPSRARDVYLRIVSLVSMVCWPALVLLAVTAPELVPVVFGKQWFGSIIPIQVMALSGLLRPIFNPSGALIKAFGRVYQEMWLQMFYALTLAAGALIGVRWGIIGVSAGASAALMITCIPIMYLIQVCCSASAVDIAKAVRGATYSSLVVLCVSVCCRSLMLGRTERQVPVLCATLALGLVAWFLSVILNPFEDWRKLRSSIGGIK